LKEQYGFNYETNCDVECILHLYASGGIEHCARSLDGVFVFCIVVSAKQRVFVGRDPYGVRPVFRLYTVTGILGISSEAKGLCCLCTAFNLHWSSVMLLHGPCVCFSRQGIAHYGPVKKSVAKTSVCLVMSTCLSAWNIVSLDRFSQTLCWGLILIFVDTFSFD
jgi:asparagine synthetase B (glutamine-hydrolysing)